MSMDDDFYCTKNKASSYLDEMYENYFELKRKQEAYLEIGEKDQAEALQEVIDDLDNDIQFEENMYRQAFH